MCQVFYSQVGRDKLSLHELNKGTVVYSQSEGQEFFYEAIVYDFTNKSKSKKEFSTWSQNWLLLCNKMCSLNLHLSSFLLIFNRWINPLFKIGHKRRLEKDDMYSVLPEDRCQHLGEKLQG